MGLDSLAEKHLGVGEDVNRAIRDEFLLRSEELVDEDGEPCEFEVSIRTESRGHGDSAVDELAHLLRAAAYDAMHEFDERIRRKEERDE